MSVALDRIRREQAACGEYVRGGGVDVAGAVWGWADWLMEEAIITMAAREEYLAFLESKQVRTEPVGFDVPPDQINPMLFPFQRDIVRWALRGGKRAIFSECGCVAGDTILSSPDGDERIDALASRGRPIRVWALAQSGNTVIADATVPFLKGIAPLYRFALKSGRSITITGDHRFLTPLGWLPASHLRVGGLLAVSSQWSRAYEDDAFSPLRLGSACALSQENAADELAISGRVASYPWFPLLSDCAGADSSESWPAPRQSSSGLAQRECVEDALRSRRIPRDCRGYYSPCLRPGGEQLHAVGDIDQASTQPLAYARERNHDYSRADGPVYESSHSHLYQCIDRQPMTGLGLPSGMSSEGREVFRAFSSQPTPRSLKPQDVARYPSRINLGTQVLALSECQSASVDAQFSYSFFDTVTSINYITTGPYYDLHVPGFENYLAHGIWNHNTGKTPMQLEWARHVVEREGPALVLVPLVVAPQTVAEGRKFGIGARYVRSQAECDGPGIYVTNYEMLKAMDPSWFAGVVLDESSILKNYTGATKRYIIEAFRATPYKLACTATPSPNDHLELGNHAEFLDVMESNMMISRWFINDTMQAGNYRLKRHAEKDFWRWVASWSVCIEKPSDLGYSDDGFILPPLNFIQHVVSVDYSEGANGMLLRVADLSATSLHKELRLTAADRAAEVARLVNGSSEPWIVWCNTDYEADELTARIPGAVEVRGSMPLNKKESRLQGFRDGDFRVIVTKPGIAGYGLNYQHCNNMAFVGLSYSFEDLYQAIRRSWRYGQAKPVNAHVVTAETEGPVLQTIERKRAQYEEMKRSIVEAVREMQLGGQLEKTIEMKPRSERGQAWEMRFGDCVEACMSTPDNHVHLSVFSPPFSNLYIYSNSIRDMGNTEDDEEFMRHFGFLIPQLYRITKPGRLCVVHCKDLPKYKNRDGEFGLRDFPGAIVAAFESHGWAFHSRVTIWKCPVTEMQRTKNHGLLYKELCKDSTVSRQGMADYLVVFRKTPGPGDAIEPVTSHGERFEYYAGLEPPDAGFIAQKFNLPAPSRIDGRWPKHNPFPRGTDAYRDWSITVWQKYASPVWMDIDQMDVLNYEIARGDKDEKHICPLQLQVIERAVLLWSNPQDLIYSPYAGIGSEGERSIERGRRFLGDELSERYFRHACKNLRDTEWMSRAQMGMFDGDAE